MKARTIILVALSAAAGCGGGETTQEPRGPASESWRAQAEATCVKFLRFPGYPYAGPRKKGAVLEQLDFQERRMAVVTEAPPDDADYRRLVVEPATRVEDAIGKARERVRAGDPPEYAYIDFSRERDEFDEAYVFAAEDLRLQKCIEERLRTDELDTEFRRSAKSICEDAEIEPLESDAPMREFEKMHDELARVTDELASLKPPERVQREWRQTVGATERFNGEIRKAIEVIRDILGGGGEDALRTIDAMERRMDAASRRAGRGFRALHFKECADLF